MVGRRSPQDEPTAIELKNKESTANCKNVFAVRHTEMKHSRRNIQPSLPRFDGSGNVTTWLMGFRFAARSANVPESDWVEESFAFLEGPVKDWAMCWYTEAEENQAPLGWNAYKDALITFMGADAAATAYKDLADVKQTSSVKNYATEWQGKAVLVPRKLSMEEKVALFIKGLQPGLLTEVAMRNPKTVEEATNYASTFEHRYVQVGAAQVRTISEASSENVDSLNENFVNVLNLDRGRRDNRPDTSRHKAGTSRHDNSRGQATTRSARSDANGSFRCFICNKPGHLARDCRYNNHDRGRQDYRANKQNIHYLSGFKSSPLLIHVCLNGCNAKALVDSGASLNFVSTGFVKSENILTKPCQKIYLKIADGYEYESSRVTDNTRIMINGMVTPFEGYLFDFGKNNEFDIILGTPWLHDVNPFIDWRTSCIYVGANGSNHKETLNVMTSSHNLQELLNAFGDIFESPQTLPPTRSIEHELRLTDNIPVCSGLRPMSPNDLQAVKKELDSLTLKGFIRPSTSPYGAPVLLVPEKDNTVRMCVDYRALNSKTIKDGYPLPRIDSLLARVGSGAIFSTIDLKSGFYQVKMKAADIEKTAFQTHFRAFEFLVMPFGLRNAPATFMCLMNDVLREFRLFSKFTWTILLSLISSEHEHLEHLATIFAKFQNHLLD